jgi:hypothetical protein
MSEDRELQAIRDVAHMSGRISVNALKEIMAKARTPDEQADNDVWIIAVLQRTRALELELDLRREWWLNHKCGQLAYGDDGEMQCCMVDFKRTPIDKLRLTVEALRLKNTFQREEDVCANCNKPYQDHLLWDGNKCHAGSVAGWFPKRLADALRRTWDDKDK